MKFTTFFTLFLLALAACAPQPTQQVFTPSETPIPYSATLPPPTTTLIPPTQTPTAQISDTTIAEIHACSRSSLQLFRKECI